MIRSMKTPKGTELPLRDLRGKEYLEVKYRLVWFREEKPNWSIETEIAYQDGDSATVKATIKDEQGRIMSTAHKHEDRQGFADFREKAETGAIGRALAHIGYGTQFAPELDEGERIVDAPADRRPTPPPPQVAPKSAKHQWEGNPDADIVSAPLPFEKPAIAAVPDVRPITQPQANRLYAIARGKGYGQDQVDLTVRNKYARKVSDLNRTQYDEICNFYINGPVSPQVGAR